MISMTDTKHRIAASAAALAATAVCTLLTFVTPIETTSIKIIGSFISVVIVSLAAWKFPLHFYRFALIFDFFAAALGSVINLYRSIGFYDRFVHYLSGILLAGGGMIIFNYIAKKRSYSSDRLIAVLFAFFFSCSCAGFWEIYEFTADILINANMQGGNSNTMGDIVSGVLGALTYAAVYALKIRRRSGHNENQ